MVFHEVLQKKVNCAATTNRDVTSVRSKTSKYIEKQNSSPAQRLRCEKNSLKILLTDFQKLARVEQNFSQQCEESEMYFYTLNNNQNQ